MNETEFKERTKKLGLASHRSRESLPNGRTAEVLGQTIIALRHFHRSQLQSGMSRKVYGGCTCQARIVEEEADESAYWLELLIESKTVMRTMSLNYSKRPMKSSAMVVASIKTLRGRL